MTGGAGAQDKTLKSKLIYMLIKHFTSTVPVAS